VGTTESALGSLASVRGELFGLVLVKLFRIVIGVIVVQVIIVEQVVGFVGLTRVLVEGPAV